MADNDLVGLLRSQNVLVFNQVATILTENQDTLIDLAQADLSNLDLSEVRLWRCDLTGANLSNSKLRAFVLAGALLRSTNLTNTSFVDDPEPLNQILMLWNQDADAGNAYRKQKSRIV